MSYHGDILLGQTLYMYFNTVDTGSVPFTLGASPTAIAYPNASTTEVTAGITLGIDHDTGTGLHRVTIVATSGNGFATATDYVVVLNGGTVDGVSVDVMIVGSFSIENRSALRPATAGRTLVVDLNGLADANVVKLGPSGSGTAQTARDIGASVVVTSNLKKNQALANFQFEMYDALRVPQTGKVGSMVAARVIDGGSYGIGTLTGLAEIANGSYRVNFGAGDLNGNTITLRVTATGCVDTFVHIVTQP